MKQQTPESVREKLHNLPDKPGCYLMRDGEGKVIYVGKAIVLHNRVRSYFHASASNIPRHRRWWRISGISPGG